MAKKGPDQTYFSNQISAIAYAINKTETSGRFRVFVSGNFLVKDCKPGTTMTYRFEIQNRQTGLWTQENLHLQIYKMEDSAGSFELNFYTN